MKKSLSIFLSSILAGLFIGLGSVVYLSCLASSNLMIVKILGSFLFGLGLFGILSFSLWLYTGKIGLVLDNKPSYLLDLLICLLGNAVGAVATGLLIRLSRLAPALSEVAKNLVSAKQGDTWYSILILSFFCGICIYIAVKGFKESEKGIFKVLFTFLPVMAFILSGFEHVVANMVYYTIAGVFDWKALLYFFLMALGNSLGSIAFDLLFKGIKRLTKKD